MSGFGRRGGVTQRRKKGRGLDTGVPLGYWELLGSYSALSFFVQSGNMRLIREVVHKAKHPDEPSSANFTVFNAALSFLQSSGSQR